MKLKYGKEEIQLPIQDENIIKILNSRNCSRRIAYFVAAGSRDM